MDADAREPEEERERERQTDRGGERERTGRVFDEKPEQRRREIDEGPRGPEMER